MARKQFTAKEVEIIAETLGVDRDICESGEFQRGMQVELEHGQRDPRTDVTGDDPILTGKIALAHLREFPDYYTRLDRLETEAEEYWKEKKKSC
jgi:hypothetical protein